MKIRRLAATMVGVLLLVSPTLGQQAWEPVRSGVSLSEAADHVINNKDPEIRQRGIDRGLKEGHFRGVGGGR